MLIHDVLVKDAILTCCDTKRRELQVYLLDELPMRYDFNLFQFILNLMEILCLVQECMNMLGWVVEVNCKYFQQQTELENATACW